MHTTLLIAFAFCSLIAFYGCWFVIREAFEAVKALRDTTSPTKEDWEKIIKP